MNRSFKFILSAALLLCGCSFIPNKASAEVIATHETCSFEPWIGFTVEKEGDDVCVKFGDFTPQYKEKRKRERIEGKYLADRNIEIYVREVLADYHANIAIFDNIKYEYDAKSETLTVTGYEGSKYATAYNFVVSGLAYYDVRKVYAIQENQRDRNMMEASQSNPQTESQFKDAYYSAKMGSRSEYAHAVTSTVKVPLIKKVVILGNVQKISDNFCTVDTGASMKRSYGVETVDMSGSDVKVICNRAFRNGSGSDQEVRDIKYPAGRQPKIGEYCFGRAAGQYVTDNFVPVSGKGAIIVDSCCIIS